MQIASKLASVTSAQNFFKSKASIINNFKIFTEQSFRNMLSCTRQISRMGPIIIGNRLTLYQPNSCVFFLCLDLLTCYVIGVWELILNFTEKFNRFFKLANQPLDIVHESNINTLKNCRLFQRFEFESQLWYTYFVQSSSLHTWTCASQSKSNSDGKPTTDVIACIDFNRNTGFLHAQDHLIANSNFGIR